MTHLSSKVFPEINSHPKTVHFIGIGGIGMSALARWFRSQKTPVSGSDLAKSSITETLAKEGVGVKIGHKKGNLPTLAGLVIYTKAVEKGNPELVEARRKKIPILLYSEAVGRLTDSYKTIAIAGAHGKSTTAAIMGLVMVKAGLDPTVIVGTNLKEFSSAVIARSPVVAGRRGNPVLRRLSRNDSRGVNFRHGKSDCLVLEADEFGRSFLNYSPTVAIVTNIDLDHLDTYKNLADVQKTFLKFLANIKHGGAMILNKDSENLYSLRNRVEKIAKRKTLKIYWYSISRHSHVFVALNRVLKISGEHNLSNALAVYSTARVLGIPENKTLSAIGAYRGAWRRMEYKGKFQIPNSKFQIHVYDDYAHHPTEIRATLKAFREKYPHSPIVCVYQPHQALRLKKLWKDFVDAFTDANVLVLLPIYQVAGRDRVNPRFTSRKLALAIKKKYPRKQVFYLANPKKIKNFLVGAVNGQWSMVNGQRPAVVVMMGAGDIVNYTPYLFK